MYKITIKKADKCVTSKIEIFRRAMGFQKGRAIRVKVACHLGLPEYAGISTKAQWTRGSRVKR